MPKEESTIPDSVLKPLLERFEGPVVRFAARITGDVERARPARHAPWPGRWSC